VNPSGSGQKKRGTEAKNPPQEEMRPVEVNLSGNPLKETGKEAKDKGPATSASQEEKRSVTESPRKRKSNDKGTHPDLNKPVHESSGVPVGLVYDRLAQLDKTMGRTEETTVVQKKQRVSPNQSAISARAAGSSPRRA
jgi:hypothetical protein